MSEPHELSKNRRAHFARMRTEELENILRLDFQLPAGEGLDEDTNLYITEVIARREASSSQTSCPNVDVAWQDLLTRYLPDGTTDLLGGDASADNAPAPRQPSPAVHRHSRGIRWMIRIAGVAAILAILFFVTTITAYALGYDVWGTIAKWSSETFSFAEEESRDNSGESGQSSTSPEFSSLQEALDYYDIETAIAPTWIPERFVMESVSAADIPGMITFCSNFVCEENNFIVSIIWFEKPPQQYSQWQKDEGDPTPYTVGGVTHYLMTNMGRQKAVWINGACECGITGDISKAELIAMIDSIYEERK